jgi:Flp pilus assembly protein TadB
VLSAVAAVVLVGGTAGVVLGLAVAVGVRLVVPRLQGEQERRRDDQLARQAPLTVDLVAACLASGAPPDVAVEASARAVGAPTADLLLPAVAALRLGADPEGVWREIARVDGLAALARAFARSQQTGAALSDLLPRVADEVRAAARARADARIRTAAVRLTAPLGVALLPAFVLLGVVPVVASWVGVLL